MQLELFTLVHALFQLKPKSLHTFRGKGLSVRVSLQLSVVGVVLVSVVVGLIPVVVVVVAITIGISVLLTPPIIVVSL